MFGGMKRLDTIFHRRSVSWAALALFFGLTALMRVPNFIGLAQQSGREFVLQSLVICIVTLTVCTTVLANLIRDVNRGYSPGRCSLAAVILLAAFAGPAMLALALMIYFSR